MHDNISDQPILSAEQAFDDLLQRYQTFYENSAVPMLAPVVEDWTCPIHVRDFDAAQFVWQPQRQQQPQVFTDLEAALEQPFHPDFAILYQRWYAADLNVSWQQHPLVLLQVMGPEDAEQLQVNMAGHVLMKRRLRQPPTLFLGLAAEADDLLVTLDNDSGKIGLEWVGKPQHEILADSLAAFLQGLTPTQPAAVA